MKKQKKHEEWLSSIPVPFTIQDIRQRGKEVGIFLDTGAIMIRSFGQGSYLSAVKVSDLTKEPFATDGFVAFCGEEYALVIVDCRSFHHQVKVEFVPNQPHQPRQLPLPLMMSTSVSTVTSISSSLPSPSSDFSSSDSKHSGKQEQKKQSLVDKLPTPEPYSPVDKLHDLQYQDPHDPEFSFWNKQRGPCVLTQQLQFENNFLRLLKDPKKRDYFKSHSIAHVMFNQSICNGLGHYTVSEILFHFYIEFGIRPWEIAWSLFMKHEGLLESLLCAPTLFFRESKFYITDFDPACFDIVQQRQKTSYRLDFLKVFEKKTFRRHEVVCFAFSGPKGQKTIYTVGCAAAELPVHAGIRSGEIHPESKLKFAPENENWFRVTPNHFTPGQLGVGPADFHRPSEIPLLVEDVLRVHFHRKRLHHKTTSS